MLFEAYEIDNGKNQQKSGTACCRNALQIKEIDQRYGQYSGN